MLGICSLMRGKHETIEEFFRQVKGVGDLIQRVRGKEPTIKFGFDREGTAILWVDFYVEER